VMVRVWVRRSSIAGLGLFAAQDIKQGTRILPYIGEKIPKAESTRRLAQGNVGFDHGVGHSLLALCDAKAPRGQK
jgi:hypothetical protein